MIEAFLSSCTPQMRQDVELSSPEERNRIIAKVVALKTRSDAAAYLAGVATKRNAAKAQLTTLRGDL
jgi:hypothetical protein